MFWMTLPEGGRVVFTFAGVEHEEGLKGEGGEEGKLLLILLKVSKEFLVKEIEVLKSDESKLGRPHWQQIHETLVFSRVLKILEFMARHFL